MAPRFRLLDLYSETEFGSATYFARDLREETEVMLELTRSVASAMGMGYHRDREHPLVQRAFDVMEVQVEGVEIPPNERNAEFHTFLTTGYRIPNVSGGLVEASHDSGLAATVFESLRGIHLPGFVWRFGTFSPTAAAAHLRWATRAIAYLYSQERRGVFTPSNFVLVDGIQRYSWVDAEAFGLVDFWPCENTLSVQHTPETYQIYSLGGVLYFMLTGCCPIIHDGETLAARLVENCMLDVTPITEYRNDVPPAMEELLYSMLAKHPENRPQSFAEVHERLSDWV